MMNKTKSPKWHGLKNSMVLISIVTVVALTSSFETKIVAQNPDNEPEVLVNGKKSDMQTFRNINQHKVDSIVYHAQNQSSYGQAKKSTIEIYTGDTLKPLKSGNWDNVKVVGYANQKRDTLGIRCTSESGATIMISDKSKIPLIFLDGKKVSYEVINNSHPKEMRVIEGKDAISKYGEEGKNGVFLCYSSIQEPNPGIALRNVKKPGTNPLCFINGKRVTNDEFKSIKPEDISALTVFTGNDAIEKYGSEAKDGVMLLYTKPDSQIPRGIDIRNAGIPRNPLYVVNGKVEPDLDLSTINPNEVDKIEVITDADVIKKYGVQGRDVAIKITLKGVKEVATLSNSLSLTPNPTSNNVDITLKGTKTSGMFDVKIFDKYGKLLVQDKKSGPTFTVSVAGLPTGAYVVAVTDGKNKYTGNLSVVH